MKKKELKARYIALLNSPGRGEEFEAVGLEYLTILNPAMAEQVKRELGM